MTIALLANGTAHAVTLQTPYVHVNAAQRIRVEVSNLGTKDVPITVTLTRSDGVVLPGDDHCADVPTLAAGTSCLVNFGFGVDGRVTATSKGKVRAAINVLGSTADSEPLVTVVPATK
jgi:hypothetical protein